MNYNEYLLTKLAEECSELAQIASKMNVFGVDSYDPKDEQKITNEEHMNIEYNDIIAVMEMLKESMLLDVYRNEELISKKKSKMYNMWQISKKIKFNNGE